MLYGHRLLSQAKVPENELQLRYPGGAGGDAEATQPPRVVFQKIGRESNVLAHELAQLAVRLNYSTVWHGRVPFCVERCVAHDANVQS